MYATIIGIWLSVFLTSANNLNVRKAAEVQEDGKDTNREGISTAERIETGSEMDTSSSRTALEVESTRGTEDTNKVAENEDENMSSCKDATSVRSVENGNTVRRMKVPNYAEFDPNKVYIIRHQEKSEDGDGTSQYISYWVGERSSLDDAVFAATYAVSNTTSAIIIRREAVGLESDSFKALFEIDEAKGSSVVEERAGIRPIEENATRMILIQRHGQIDSDTFETQEVEFSSTTLSENGKNCWVAFNSSKVYVFCGMHAGFHERTLARKLSDVLRKNVVPRATEFTLIYYAKHERQRNLFQQFSNEFNRIAQKIEDHKAETARKAARAARKRRLSPSRLFGLNRTPVQSETIDHEKVEADTSKTDKVTVLHIHNDTNENTPLKESVDDPTITLESPFRTEDCYLVDSGIGRIGLLVWLGEKSSVTKHKECARRAELLLREKQDCDLRPIIFVDEKRSDLLEFPIVFGTIQNLVVLVKKLNMSWEDIILPYPEDTPATY